MAPTYTERYIPKIKTEAVTCSGAATVTTLTTGAGSLTAPAIVCPTDADTGLYWNGTNLQFGVDGSLRAFWSGNGLNTIRYGSTPARMYGYSANGTDEAPTATTDGKFLFEFAAHGHNGTTFAPSGFVRFRQDGAISGANCPGSVTLVSRNSSGGALDCVVCRASGTTEIKLGLAHQGSTLGFYNTTPTTKPTITGSRGGNAALADLLTKLAGLGLLTDSTS